MRLKLDGCSRVFGGRWRLPIIAVSPAGLGLLLALAGPAGAEEPPALYAELRAPAPRFGLVDEGAGTAPSMAPEPAPAEPSGPTPFVAGLLSALIPGTGQLAQGQSRGFLYLGIEVASWFAYFSLQDAGDQALEDAYDYVGDVESPDGKWAWDRYLANPPCGDNLGPDDLDTEKVYLQDLYDNSPDNFYADIGSEDIYACGWVDQGARAEYQSMIDDSNSLYSDSDIAVGVIVANHLVSAVDAAKSAASRRKKESRTLSWQVRPDRNGFAARVQLTQSF